MRVRIEPGALHQTKWFEYAIRFVIGGGITVITGILAKSYGPVVGGLFLAFPAILPASATLVSKHEKQKNAASGHNARMRGRRAAGVDAAGSAIGSIGLIAFATFAWQLLPSHSAVLVLAVATLAWVAVAVSLWTLRKLFSSRILKTHRAPQMHRNH
jgi:uncharacterized protein DUF3147